MIISRTSSSYVCIYCKKTKTIAVLLTWWRPWGSASTGRWFWSCTGWTGRGTVGWSGSGRVWPALCCCTALKHRWWDRWCVRRKGAECEIIRDMEAAADLVRPAAAACWGAAGLCRRPVAARFHPDWLQWRCWSPLQIGAAVRSARRQTRPVRRRRKPPGASEHKEVLLWLF